MTGPQTRVNGNSTLEMGSSNQELLSHENKRKVTIVFLGVCIILVVIVFVSFSLIRPNLKPKPVPVVSNVHSIDINELVNGHYNPKTINSTWISDNELLYNDSSGNIVLFNVADNKKDILISNLDNIVQKPIKRFVLSADRRFLLVAHSYQKRFSNSYFAYYLVINLQTKAVTHVTDIQGTPRQLLLAQWSPIGNALAFVFMNDIFYWPSVEMPMQEIRLTRNGRSNTIHNGVPNWVYEEEVFINDPPFPTRFPYYPGDSHGISAMWFSKDGKKLAFVTFNDTTTPVMSIPQYGKPGSIAFQYTQTINMRYPKAGRPTPVVSISVIDVASLNPQSGIAPYALNILPPKDLTKMEPVLSAVTWASNVELAAVWMNRHQNKAHITLCSTSNDSCRIIMSIEEPLGWVSLFKPPMFSTDGTIMILIYTSDQVNDEDKYRHIIQLDLRSNESQPVPLTNGKYEVTDILAWDEINHEIYFVSSAEDDPSQRRVSKISDSPLNAPHSPLCMSCQTITVSGKKCLFAKSYFSERASYYIETCAGPEVPEIRLFDKSGRELIIWERNDDLREVLERFTLPEIKQFRIPTKDGVEAIVKFIMPPDIDTSGKTKYPLLIQVFGAPDTNFINNEFYLDWGSYMSVNHSIIYAFIEGRNSGMRGDKMRFAGHRRMGTVETEDVIFSVKYIHDHFAFIDKTRTGIWGWSYGGYNTLMILIKDTSNLIECGVAKSPIIDFLYYDAVYTDRIMGLPTVEDNMEGYMNASLLNKVSKLKHKKFFVLHGTSDEFVHFQQSMMFNKMLQTHDILFNWQAYPDKDHWIHGSETHVYHSMENYFIDCLKL
ncbi:venom dipeptidyl peptidase 4-like isoform X2 [Lycorma delicatula]|uniref:venom dipeptidyl peptidase 4-like isoform X2 n=1 Tax=Lycorma delicatula TaxID=130591 RepID=UPI003F5188E8